MSKGLIRSSDVKGNETYDIILRAWLDHKRHELPAELSGMLERWEMVDKLFRQGDIIQIVNKEGKMEPKLKRFNFSAIVEWLRERYNVSARTAYEDIRNAKRFFCITQGREDIEYGRGVAAEIGDQLMWEARDAGDYDAAAKFYKEANDIRGYHDQQVEGPDYSEFVPPNFTMVADPTELGFEALENEEEIVKRILSQKRIDFLDNEATDAEVVE